MKPLLKVQDIGDGPETTKPLAMLRNMFLLFTVMDVFAIQAVLDSANPELAQFALMWLLFYSSVAAWALGLRAWKECQGDCPGPQALLRILTCSSLFFGACAAIIKFGGSRPEQWAGIYVFILIYLIRLTPAAAATVLLTPFLWVSQPKGKTLTLVAISQICCWYGGWVVFQGQQGWREAFLHLSLWAPNWGYALMIGGLLIKPLLKKEEKIPPGPVP